MKRLIDQELKKWKASSGRKALLLRGARQVGKTFAVRNLGGHICRLLGNQPRKTA
jgi:predicted AAA+ superfamily ATPase